MFHGNLGQLYMFFGYFPGLLDWIVHILVWFERALHPAQVPWPLKLMKSQLLKGMWIHTDGYSGGSRATMLKRSKTTIFSIPPSGRATAPFLERPGYNLAHRPVNFASLTDSFISSFSKLLKLPEKLPGLSRNGPQIRKSRRFTSFTWRTVLPIAEGRDGSKEVRESNEPPKKPKNRYLQSEDRNLPIAAV